MAERKLKVGVVGCGVVATAYYLPYLMRHADLVAVCDLYETRTAACQRLFGAAETYQDYDEMLQRADIEAVWILTGPGTHASFTIKAAQAGKHVLVQKPMCITLQDADAMVAAVRHAGIKCLVEPSSNTILDPIMAQTKALLDKGVLGDPHWFVHTPTGPTQYHPSLSGNPYGFGAFYARDSGGLLFDYAYFPTLIATLMGPCKSVTGMANVSVPDRHIVPEAEYDKFLDRCTDPDEANYWDLVVDLERSHTVKMEAEDNVFCLYEMANGCIGCIHAGRIYHPTLPGTRAPGLQVFGSDGNLILGGGHAASFITTRKTLLPKVDRDGWYHIASPGDPRKAKWPKPTPGAYNYYHASSQHLIDCIREDRDPLPNVEWGRHVTEMMTGAIQSARTGQRYEMTTTPE